MQMLSSKVGLNTPLLDKDCSDQPDDPLLSVIEQMENTEDEFPSCSDGSNG